METDVRWANRHVLHCDPYAAGITCMDFGRMPEIGWSEFDASADVLDIRTRLALAEPVVEREDAGLCSAPR